MQPNETLFLESSNKITKENICNSAFVDFELWDLPGQTDSFDPSFDPQGAVYGVRGSLIFVIDAQVRVKNF
jgi:Ras-related GTP-binding protein C/D